MPDGRAVPPPVARPAGPDGLTSWPTSRRRSLGAPPSCRMPLSRLTRVVAPHDPADLPEGFALAVGTSGSTGRPKRTMLTAAALTASASATHEVLGGTGTWLLALPAHHIAGLQVLIRSLVGGTQPSLLDLRDGFTAATFARAAAALSTNPSAPRRYTSLVPTQLGRLLDDRAGLEALRVLRRRARRRRSHATGHGPAGP